MVFGVLGNLSKSLVLMITKTNLFEWRKYGIFIFFYPVIESTYIEMEHMVRMFQGVLDNEFPITHER